MNHRSCFQLTPKVMAALRVILEVMERGEQAVLFSVFHHELDCYASLLAEAGIAHGKMDGRMTQKRRGTMSASFKARAFPILLAGVESCAEGHSWDNAKNCILTSYSWAYDRLEQAVNRVHRLTSREDVNVYSIICQGTIDRRLESLIQEKGEAAELVLDGSLREEESQEVNLFELLRDAQAEAADTGPTVCERELAKQWPALKQALTQAMEGWGHGSKAEGQMLKAKANDAGSAGRSGTSAFSPQPSAFQRNPFLARLRKPSTINHQPSTASQWQDTPLFAACV